MFIGLVAAVKLLASPIDCCKNGFGPGIIIGIGMGMLYLWPRFCANRSF